jgi:hypothetical protein
LPCCLGEEFLFPTFNLYGTQLSFYGWEIWFVTLINCVEDFRLSRQFIANVAPVLCESEVFSFSIKTVKISEISVSPPRKRNNNGLRMLEKKALSGML